MTKPNLTDALEVLSWADREIYMLGAEFSRLAETYPYTIITNEKADRIVDFYIEVGRPPLRPYAHTIKSIIQAQRSSLDYMVVALAEANGAVDPRDTQFPVTSFADGLADKRTRDKVGKLKLIDREAIFNLRPHGGEDGNKVLYALHQMNIEQKHRRLSVIGMVPSLAGFGAGPKGSARLYGLHYNPPVMLSEGRHKIATAEMEGDLKLNISLSIAFSDVPRTQATPDAIMLLREFSRTCREIVTAFS